jgi:hypothetical protein
MIPNPEQWKFLSMERWNWDTATVKRGSWDDSNSKSKDSACIWEGLQANLLWDFESSGEGSC